MPEPYAVIELTKGYVAIISRKHLRKVNKHSWHVHFSKGTKRKHGQPYARTTINGVKVYLHRFVLSADAASHVDHNNYQTLDCRDGNLEETTPAINISSRRPRARTPLMVSDL